MPDYDRIAPFYDLLSGLVFGQQLSYAESYFYSHLKDLDSILVFGGGTGKCLKALQQLYPKASIHYLEASSRMISIASKRTIPSSKSVDFIHGNEQVLVDHPLHYDLVITSFVLDVFCKNKLNRVMDILHQVLVPGGYWIQTDFYVGRNSPWWQKAMVPIMYLFFRLTAKQSHQQLEDFDDYFKKRSLNMVAQKEFYSKMIKTVLYRKTQEIDPNH